MDVKIIPATTNLIETVAESLHAIRETGDYSSHLVVFPGKRPAHFLRKRLAQKLTASYIPPQIFSIDEFIYFLYETKLGRHNRLLDTIDAVALLYEIHLQSRPQLGGAHFLSSDSFFPLGIKLFTDLEELYIESVSPENVQQINALISVPSQTLARLQSLSFFYTEFYQRIAEKGYSTRASRYRAVNDAITEDIFAPFSQIIFAGFFALTKTEQTMVNQFRDWDKVSFIFQNGTGLDRKLAELGITDIPKQSDVEPQLNFYKSPDTHGQVFAIHTLLASQKDSGTRPQKTLDEKTAIILPAAETLFPLIQHALGALNEENYNIALGYPLYRTPLFGFFNSLMEVISSFDEEGRVYIPRYLEFMLHPYTKNIYFDTTAEITRIIIHTLEEELTAKRTRTFWKIAEIESDQEIQHALQTKLAAAGLEKALVEVRTHLHEIHQNTIGKLSTFKTVGEFAEQAKAILTYIYEHSTARLHQFFEPYSEAFLQALDTISKSLMHDITFADRNSYFTLFRKYIQTCTVPFTGTPLRGLQVLGLLETRSLQFDSVYLLDCNEGIIPGTSREDTLLPFKTRQMLGLPTYLDRELLIEYGLSILINGAKEVHFLFIENDEKEKSRYLEKLLWQKQKSEKVENANAFIRTIQYEVQLHTEPPQPIEKTAEMIKYLKEFEFSPTALNTYLTCPLQFYYAEVLNLQKKEEFTDQWEKQDIGKFVHAVLAEYFGRKRNQLLTPAKLSIPELNTIIEHRFREFYGAELVGGNYLLNLQMKTHLREFIELYQLPLVEQTQVTVLDLEKRIAIQKDGFKLKGFLDRIDRCGNKIIIYDYKIASNEKYYTINFNKLDFASRETWNEAIPTLQLPFYQLLYSATAQNPISQTRSMFLLLGKKGISQNIECPLFAPDIQEPADKLDMLIEIIFKLLNEIIDPNVAFTPSKAPKNTCPNCPYSNICNRL